ncbi:hypothetical protein C5Y96_05795 [Blastopirellula marina]|uniref:Uncharacterized protein n=1 Tax=Blastopirellula marina TaxID=124 RepID=A0A2S8G4I7_9BACT|nr:MULTISPECIES: hypothetical protein [Pirellulaceae]PQO39366.1 hypothetical protein C5Y96_05795 [Blastopirellula marina]RCS55674.1 hypothetical protein DTL36_05805 [Bremerella cremea]
MPFDFVDEIETQLDPAARQEFGPIERQMLRRTMEHVGMTEYPPAPMESHGFQRAAFDCICQKCGKAYGAHPMDWRVIGYGDVPFLNVLCDGQRVKL